MKALKKKYVDKVIPSLQEKLGIKNKMAVPRLEKVVINIGTGKGLKDAKYLETCEKTLLRISGQKPVVTKAKKSISAFKIRDGMSVGMKVTLRGGRAFDFTEKFINTTLPRVRDFRGIDPKSVDKQGNITVGFNEHMVFPEIMLDEVEITHGLEVSFQTTAKNREQGLEYFRAINFPFKVD